MTFQLHCCVAVGSSRKLVQWNVIVLYLFCVWASFHVPVKSLVVTLLVPYFFRTRIFCKSLTSQDWFDFIILTFIAANCITLAVERPTIPPWSEKHVYTGCLKVFPFRSTERHILSVCNTVFTCVFTVEMAMKAVANGFILGHNNYFSDNWNRLDGTLVIISLIDGIITMFAGNQTLV